MATTQPLEEGRTSRASDLREHNPARPPLNETRSFVPAGVMPEPNPEPGYDLGWVRVSALGFDDVNNVNKAYRENWRPCSKKDHPELHMETYGGFRNDAKQGDEIVIGGLMLMKRPSEYGVAKQKYYEGITDAQIRGVEARYKADAKQVSQMPLDEFQTNTEVEFGQGGRK